MTGVGGLSIRYTGLDPTGVCDDNRAMSASTIIATSDAKSTLGCQPSTVRALEASPTSRSTSAGRRNRGSVTTCCRQSSPTCREGQLHQFLHRVTHAGGHDEVVGRVLLQHQPHRAHVVAGKSPVAMRVQIAEGELLRQPQLDARHAVGHLARHELQAAARRLVVEQDARAGEQPVALAVVDGDVVPEDLRDAVRAARVEGRQLALGRLADLAVHLARRGLVDADGRIDVPDRFQHTGDALRVELAGQQRLIPRRGHKRHRRQVVELVRPHVGQHADERQLVQQIGRHQANTIEEVLDAPVVLGAQPPGDPDDLVALLEEQFGQVGPVLAGDSGDDCAF